MDTSTCLLKVREKSHEKSMLSCPTLATYSFMGLMIYKSLYPNFVFNITLKIFDITLHSILSILKKGLVACWNTFKNLGHTYILENMHLWAYLSSSMINISTYVYIYICYIYWNNIKKLLSFVWNKTFEHSFLTLPWFGKGIKRNLRHLLGYKLSLADQGKL